jgi:hypothetical protein
MNLRAPLFATLLGLCLIPASALADVSDADRATARTLGQDGHEALDHKDYATAADRFTRADAIVHAPTFQLGLAQAQVGLGKWVSALETYNRILREGVPDKAPPAFVKALEQARKEIDDLSPRIPYVTIQVKGSSAPAVTIDGADVPAAALGVKRPVDPGKHLIRATAPGLPPGEVTLTLVEGKGETVTIDLKPPPPPVVKPPPPPVLAKPPPPPPPPPPAARMTTRKILGITGLALGGAGIGLGAVMGGVAIAKHGSILKDCPGGTCPEGSQSRFQPEIDSYHQISAVSTAGFIGGAVLAGAGVVLLVTAPRDAPRRGAVAPIVGLGWAGAQGVF